MARSKSAANEFPRLLYHLAHRLQVILQSGISELGPVYQSSLWNCTVTSIVTDANVWYSKPADSQD